MGKTHPPNRVGERGEGKATPPNNKGKTHLPSSTGETKDLAAGTSTAGSAGRTIMGKTPDPTQEPEPESQTGSQIPSSAPKHRSHLPRSPNRTNRPKPLPVRPPPIRGQHKHLGLPHPPQPPLGDAIPPPSSSPPD